jgi:hypothetical protein
MDGTFATVPEQLAADLAEAEKGGNGLTGHIFERLVRTIWRMTSLETDVHVLKLRLEEQLASLGGLQIQVRASGYLAGAIDVTGVFMYGGTSVSHTVHLW